MLFASAYKPLEINHEEAVACLLGGIWSYTALHYHFKLSPGETVLVLNGETRFDQVWSIVRFIVWLTRIGTQLGQRTDTLQYSWPLLGGPR